jgi:hypothetical protein
MGFLHRENDGRFMFALAALLHSVACEQRHSTIVQYLLNCSLMETILSNHRDIGDSIAILK